MVTKRSVVEPSECRPPPEPAAVVVPPEPAVRSADLVIPALGLAAGIETADIGIAFQGVLDPEDGKGRVGVVRLGLVRVGGQPGPELEQTRGLG